MSPTTYYVFGQIHGNLAKLNEIFDMISQEKKSNYQVIILGDLINHGSASHKVIEFLNSPHPHAEKTTVLMGDHERMLLGFLESIEDGPLLLTHGGLDTLRCYGLDCADYGEAMEELHIIQNSLKSTIPEKHLKFLQELKPYLETDSFIFSHGGMDTKLSPAENSEDALIWGDAEEQAVSELSKTLVYIKNHSTEIDINVHKITLPGPISQSCYVIRKNQKPRILQTK